MISSAQYLKALQLAKQKGDAEAVEHFRKSAQTAQQEEDRAAYNPTSSMGTGRRFAAGMGQGAVNIGRQIGNITGQNSDAQMADWQQQDKALLDTKAGKWGQFAGEVATTAPIGGLVGNLARKGAARLGAPVLARAVAGAMGQGATQGAAVGGLTGGPGGRLEGAAVGGVVGAVLPKALGMAGSGVARGIKPTAAAKYLMREGVDLTPGQMNPQSTLGMLEETATSLPLVGPAISKNRNAAKAGWQGLVLKKATAPGQPAASTLDDAYASFKPGYDQVKGFPVRPAKMSATAPDQPLASFPKTRGSFEKAVRDKGILADNATRKKMNSWLQNKLTMLNKGTLKSDDLIELRSQIRTMSRDLGKGANPDTASVAMLENAERAVTEAMESQLPAGAITAGRAVDAGYGQYKTVEKAVRRAGDIEGGFTPSHLSAELKASVPQSSYARGGGGDLRKLAVTGKQALDTHVPMTGARAATLAPLAYVLGPAGSAIAGGGLAAAASTKAGRRLLAGSTAPQQVAQRATAGAKRYLGPGGRERLQALINSLAANLPDTTRNPDDAP